MNFVQTKYWLGSDLIPRLLEIFEKLKTFVTILSSINNKRDHFDLEFKFILEKLGDI